MLSELAEFEKSLIQKLNNEKVVCKKYFGELINPSKAKIDPTNTPLILVDYIGNEKINLIEKKHTFNLYIAHISFSKNENTRAKKHHELYELLQDIEQTLNLKIIDNSDRIELSSVKKIYDQLIDSGYLTVFTQKFTVNLIKGAE